MALGITLGVEVEFDLYKNNGAPYRWASPYPIKIAYYKGQTHGNIHQTHGNVALDIYNATHGQIKMEYDWTASATKDNGIELVGPAVDLETNKDMWKYAYDSVSGKVGNSPKGTTEHGTPVSTGMHVHVSGADISRHDVGKILFFVYNKDNGEFIKSVAGRLDNHFCKRLPVVDPDSLNQLFHSDDCPKHAGKPFVRVNAEVAFVHEMVARSRRVGVVNPETNQLHYETREVTETVPRKTFCCTNGKQYRTNENTMGFVMRYSKRNAVNLVPTENTGMFELRLFESPLDIGTFNARLEWSHALVLFCQKCNDVEELNYGAFCRWLMKTDRYPYLHDMLAERGYFNHIISNLEEVISSTDSRIRPEQFSKIVGGYLT